MSHRIKFYICKKLKFYWRKPTLKQLVEQIWLRLHEDDSAFRSKSKAKNMGLKQKLAALTKTNNTNQLFETNHLWLFKILLILLLTPQLINILISNLVTHHHLYLIWPSHSIYICFSFSLQTSTKSDISLLFLFWHKVIFFLYFFWQTIYLILSYWFWPYFHLWIYLLLLYWRSLYSSKMDCQT
jgi:hypothetical protein